MCCCLKVMNKTSQITPQLSTASQIIDLTFVWRELSGWFAPTVLCSVGQGI